VLQSASLAKRLCVSRMADSNVFAKMSLGFGDIAGEKKETAEFKMAPAPVAARDSAVVVPSTLTPRASRVLVAPQPIPTAANSTIGNTEMSEVQVGSISRNLGVVSALLPRIRRQPG
jgi:hypothetical protein